MTDKRTCICCRTKYEYCGRCGKGNPDEPWRNIFCSSDCRDIFNICQRFNEQKITKSEAKAELANYTIKNDAPYSDGVNECFRKFAEEEQKPKSKRKR